MTKNEFIDIEIEAKDYPFTSIKYLSYEDIKTYQVIQKDDDLILIYGMNNMSNMFEILYACYDYEVLIDRVKHYPNTLIKHVPLEYHQKLKELGYIEYAIFRDYWLHDLSYFHEFKEDVLLATIQDANEISEITKGNKGQSRSFFGEDEDFITSWILGTNPVLLEMEATHPKIYVYKENNHILGIALTCIYNHNHAKGPTHWMREIAVKVNHHHQGIGRKLMEHALSHGYMDGAKRSFLMADDLNQHAIRLYKHMGYVPNLLEQEINMITPLSK